jgi:hypothetical protein
MRVDRSGFVVSFDGPSVQDSRIDVRDLAPALLSLGNIIDSANIALNGSERKIRVEVKSTKAACFEVNLDVVLPAWEYIKSLLARLCAF